MTNTTTAHGLSTVADIMFAFITFDGIDFQALISQSVETPRNELEATKWPFSSPELRGFFKLLLL